MIRGGEDGELGFFDGQAVGGVVCKGDPLEAIDRLLPWETFRADIEAVVLTPEEMRKSSAGRKPPDAIVMFRMLVLQVLNNLSDEQWSIRCAIGCVPEGQTSYNWAAGRSTIE
jgi:hypothetical protein